MSTNPYLQKEPIKVVLGDETPGLEGIASVFEEPLKFLNDFFNEMELGKRVRYAYSHVEYVAPQKDLVAKLKNMDRDVLDGTDIAVPPFFKSGMSTYVTLLRDSVKALSNIDERLIVPLTGWFNKATNNEAMAKRKIDRLYTIDVDAIKDKVSQHFDKKKVSVRGPEVRSFGDVFKTPHDYDLLTRVIPDLNEIYGFFKYDEIEKKERELLEAVKDFTASGNRYRVSPDTRKELVDYMRAAANELEAIGILIYNAKIMVECFKKIEQTLIEAEKEFSKG